MALRLARWIIAATLAASGVWIAIAPRADQPLLDTLERAFPAIRAAYIDDFTRAVITAGLARGDASEVARIRRQAREAKRWWLAAAFLVFGFSVVVSLPRRSRTTRAGSPRPADRARPAGEDPRAGR